MRALLPLALLALLVTPPAHAASSTLPYTVAPSLAHVGGLCQVPAGGAGACFPVTGTRVVVSVSDASGNAVAYDVEYYSNANAPLGALRNLCGSPALYAPGARIIVTVHDGTGICFHGATATAGTITATFS